jgi:UDP-GlcNAc:undecaprenyl-phosphate/decaprenyl-phosphate GlcNAc-1-phosphate transferase
MNWSAMFAQFPLPSLLAALAAFLGVALLTPLVLPWASRVGWCDKPGGRKQHEAATPFIGGAVLMLVVAACFVVFDQSPSTRLMAFLSGGAVLVAVGLLDDCVGLNWRVRLAAQVGVALMIVLLGGIRAENLSDVFGVDQLYLGSWIAVPFTVFAMVGVINAVNMADGSDGLAGGLVLVALALFGAFALYAGQLLTLGRLLIVAGAVCGFLVWNMRFRWQPRARVFLGNAGSLFLGFVIAWTSIRVTQNAHHPVTPVLGPWTLALPLIDCVSLMFARFQAGRSPFAADRNHLHHVLLDAGFRPMQVALGLMAVSLALGLGAAALVKLGVYRPLLVIGFLVALGAYHRFMSDRDHAVATFRDLRTAGDRSPLPTGVRT